MSYLLCTSSMQSDVFGIYDYERWWESRIIYYISYIILIFLALPFNYFGTENVTECVCYREYNNVNGWNVSKRACNDYKQHVEIVAKTTDIFRNVCGSPNGLDCESRKQNNRQAFY